MSTKDKMIIDKQKEYIEFLGKEIGDHATYLMIHNINPLPERIEKGKQLRNELKSLESLPDRPLYEQVYIKSADDLPEDTGTHIVHIPMNDEVYSVHRETMVTQWKRFDWYLRPVK